MKVIAFGLLSFATGTLSHRHDGHRFAFHEAERACAEDMNRLCSIDERDPFMEWWMSPEVIPPPLMRFETEDAVSDPFHESNIDSLTNHMFDVALHSNNEGSTMVFIIDDSPEPVDLLDSMIGKLFAGAQDPAVVAQNVQNVGESLLEQEGADDHVHLARRLLEYNGDNREAGFDHRMQHHALFGCPKIHQCLVSAQENKQLSPPCDNAIKTLQVQKLHHGHHSNLYHSNPPAAIFHGVAEWFLVFFGVMIVTFGVLITVKKGFMKRKGDRALKRRILQAIYSNPELKAQVESELGELIGTVPPFKFMREKQGCRKRKLIFAVALTSMIAASFCCPGGAPIASLLVGLALLVRYVMCMKKRSSVSSKCSCCCCGGSPSAVVNGNVSKAQACCSCCKGTGVCSVSCADCTCCCCGASKKAVEKGNITELQACCSCCKGTGVCCASCAACCGKGLESTAGCTCCCCGASKEAAEKGNITELQACCSCCKGTGVCCASCAACCGKGVESTAGCTCCCCGASKEAAEKGSITELQACCSCCKGTGVCCGSCAECCGSMTVKTAAECACCCCGLSTENVANNCVSELQACCACCKGTGVCSELCAKCCTSGKCDDCGAGCDKSCCCGGATKIRDPKLIVYQGIPVQIV